MMYLIDYMEMFFFLPANHLFCQKFNFMLANNTSVSQGDTYRYLYRPI